MIRLKFVSNVLLASTHLAGPAAAAFPIPRKTRKAGNETQFTLYGPKNGDTLR